MDYRCRFGSLGNSSTALGRSDPGGDEGWSYCLGHRDFFFRTSFTSFHNHGISCLLLLFVNKNFKICFFADPYTTPLPGAANGL